METTINIARQRSPGVFTPRQLLAGFDAEFLGEAHCREWILEKLHHGEVRCPGCSAPAEEESQLNRFNAGRRVHCRSCGKYFSALTGTFLAGTHMSYREMVLMCLLLAAGLDNTRIGLVIDGNPETVRIWRRKFETIEALQAAEILA